MGSRISQVSFEFMVVLFIVVLITAVFGVFAGQRLSEIRRQHSVEQLEDVALAVKNEIDVAHSVELGYVRTFDLPYYLGTDNYSVGIENNFVFVSLKQLDFVLAVLPVSGTLQKGTNIISNVNGSVMLNG